MLSIFKCKNGVSEQEFGLQVTYLVLKYETPWKPPIYYIWQNIPMTLKCYLIIRLSSADASYPSVDLVGDYRISF